ncbi:MAG: ornithine carbamoyltransferase [Ilumatobacteraceae bacterium]|nr:ornithine carbamoyltransferase [Ilumatobacteraceae bacterium]
MTAIEHDVPSDLLDIADLGADGVRKSLDLASLNPRELGAPLAGRGAALIFEKPSNRTRHSSEMAVVQLGGHPVYTRGEEIGFDTREPVEDIARVMSGYHGLLAARVMQHQTLVRLAGAADVPVVNLLSDHSHPLQALADALTMEQHLGGLRGRGVAYVGDYNNVARSLAEVCVLLGADVRLGAPKGYEPDPVDVERIRGLGEGTVTLHKRPEEAVDGAHAVHTDTWVSMGQERDREERRAAFAGWTVDTELMERAAPDAVFLHCLPAYRGLEVSADVIDGPRSVVIEQAHNRMHAARGALAMLLGVEVP